VVTIRRENDMYLWFQRFKWGKWIFKMFNRIYWRVETLRFSQISRVIPRIPSGELLILTFLTF
jgi:hypothetical protein